MTNETALIDRTHRNYLWIETGVVLFVVVVPWLFTSLVSVYGTAPSEFRNYSSSERSFLQYGLWEIIHNGGPAALILFIIWKSKEPLSRYGIRSFSVPKDFLGGIAIYVLIRGIYRLFWWGIRAGLSHENYLWFFRGPSHSYSHPSGAGEYLLLAVMSLTVGLGEELVMRAYLITRLEELLESTSIAVFLSTVTFACYHAYQGNAGVIDAAIFGLIQAISFCLFRRISPNIFTHALGDFIALGRVPWFW